MVEETDGQVALRRAALTLHALCESDRSWMLDALPHEQKAPLQTLLAELAGLGISRDTALVTSHDGRTATADTSSGLDALDEAGLAALAGLLQDEPPQVAASVLAARAWPWRTMLLAAGGEAWRREVLRASTAAPAPALQAAAVEALQSAFAGLAVHSSRRLPRWQRWKERVRTWRTSR